MIQDICLLHRKDDFAYNQDPGISCAWEAIQNNKFYDHLLNTGVPAKLWDTKITPEASSLLWYFFLILIGG